MHVNFVGGRWQPSVSGRTYAKRNPARPSEIIGEFPQSAPVDVDQAVGSAAAAFGEWSRKPASQRAVILNEAATAIDARADLISRDMTAEMGKPLRESRLEVARAAQIFRFYAGEAWRTVGELYEQSANGSAVYTQQRPLGVVGLITPWNFPAAIPAWKSAPALIYGNTVVLKVAQEAPLTGLHLARCLQAGGIPAGVFNLVVGSGSDVGSHLVRHPLTRALSFTGSVAVGSLVRTEAAKQGKRIQLELGGHNPLLVLPDADLDRAVEAAYAGAYWSAGQKCTATRRIYVHESLYASFRSRLVERMQRGIVGDPNDPQTEVGPMVNEAQMLEVLAAIERGQDEGASLLAGGHRLDGEGYWVAPTLFEEVSDDAFLSCEEVFGPVVSLYSFAALDEAIHRANAVPFGLSASIFTRDAASIHKFVAELQAGMLHVNQQTAGADVHVPFGGVKASGYGPHEQGRAAREFYTESITVYADV